MNLETIITLIIGALLGYYAVGHFFVAGRPV